MDAQDLQNIFESYLEVHQLIEREDSPYEKASDAALDARYGYGRAQGDKRSFGRAANRASAAAALRAIRRGERSGSGTSREAGADAVHQGWAHTARTSEDQTPEKKERRAKLADTPYSQLPDDEKEKDRVSFDAVRAVYNRNKTQKEEYDVYDIILSHLLDEGYAETIESAEAIMVNMSEDWRENIIEAEVLAQKDGVPGSVKVRPSISIPGTSIGVGPNKPVPGTFTTTTPGQREKIKQGDTQIDRGLYKQPRQGAGPTSDERKRYNTQALQTGARPMAQ